MRILVTSTPGLGHIHALAPLMSALQVGGHDVLVVTAAESCARIESYGFAVRQGGMAAADRRAALAPRMPEVMALPPRQRRALYFSTFFAEAAAPVMRVNLTPLFDQFRPDVVIHEAAELAAGPMAVARGIPHVTVAFSGALADSAESLVIDSISPVWSAEGLPAPTIDDIGGDLYLHPFPASFGQAPTSRAVRSMRAESFDGTTGESPRWLDDVGSSARPLVYVTSGTEPASAMAPWAAAVEALGSLDVDAIATIGMHLDPSVLGDVPPNVRVERFVPQHLILDRAAVVMSHAGAGSVLGAARRGRPQLLCPLAADQWQNSDAAVGAGVAITCEIDQRSADEIRAALDRLLRDPSFTHAAAQVADEIAAMPSPTDHVATIEALAAPEPRVNSSVMSPFSIASPNASDGALAAASDNHSTTGDNHSTTARR